MILLDQDCLEVQTLLDLHAVLENQLVLVSLLDHLILCLLKFLAVLDFLFDLVLLALLGHLLFLVSPVAQCYQLDQVVPALLVPLDLVDLVHQLVQLVLLHLVGQQYLEDQNHLFDLHYLDFQVYLK